jgi:FixJ family two-component response regulator
MLPAVTINPHLNLIRAKFLASIRKAAAASGCVAFLTKPFSTQSLIEPLKKASAGH